MEKKNQIYLSAFIMYLIAGFAGYISQILGYWVVLVLSLLCAAFTMSCVFSEEKSLFKTTMFEWISVCAFAGLELILTVCISIINIPLNSALGYINLIVQTLGLLFVLYSGIKFVISYTHIDELIKEKWSNRKSSKEVIVQEESNEFAEKVEETIASETVTEDTNLDTSDVEIVGQTEAEPEVIGIECKKEKEVETPYMEEEL